MRTDPALGLTLSNRYRLDRLIGSGGMALVYRATDLALGRAVAVKLFNFAADGVSASPRHGDEVAVLARLNHFALVTLYDAGTAVIDGRSRSFIVTEFVEGTDLRSRLQKGRMRPGDVALLGADLCEALHYMAAQGIIHRDIKPANVLLAPSDFPGRVARAKLADFGIARLFDAAHRTETGTVVGTAGYLSPEQASGLSVGPATDVYSLGLVLLESLTGQHSYPGTAVESALARLRRQPEVPAWLGDGWRDLLNGMTAREPEKRLRPAEAAVRLLALAPATDAEAGTAETRLVGSLPSDPAATPWPSIDTLTIDTVTVVMPEVTAPLEPASQRPLAERTEMMRAEKVRAEAVRAEKVPAGGGLDGQPVPTAESAPAPAKRRRWPLVLGGIALALITATAMLFVFPGPEPVTAPPAYPAVGGQLGEHLQQLQESVDP